MINSCKVKTTNWLTKGISEKKLNIEKRKALKEFERKNMEEVKVICPKCGNCMTYKNWFSWIWHTPFHWFGQRRAKCTNCGKYSYMGRLRSK